jgi:hypothetical protein
MVSGGTTVAALYGTLPIALGFGEGADARQPLGLAVVGGLVVSQFLTLYITRVIYLYLERLQEWLQKDARRRGMRCRRRRGEARFARGAGGIGVKIRSPELTALEIGLQAWD